VSEKEWASNKVVTRGKVYLVDQLPGFVAMQNDERVGLLTYKINNEDCEIITLNSFIENRGIGSDLLDKIESFSSSIGCKRIWLITTNDNLNALRFYQKKGYKLSAFYQNAVEKARKLKPEIPPIGLDGIPIRDEIELEKIL
jgi:ribosomal protein S18 acetylase RimI-like enzyme